MSRRKRLSTLPCSILNRSTETSEQEMPARGVHRVKNCRLLEAPFAHWNSSIRCDSASSRNRGTELQGVRRACQHYQPTSGMESPPSYRGKSGSCHAGISSSWCNALSIIHISRFWFRQILKKNRPRPFASSTKGGGPGCPRRLVSPPPGHALAHESMA